MQLQFKPLYLLLALLLVVPAMGCNKRPRASIYGASCKVSLVNLPEEFYLITEDVRNRVSIEVWLWQKSPMERHECMLDESNGFSAEITDIFPGVYKVVIYVPTKNLVPMDIVANMDTIELVNDTKSELVMHIKDPKDFVDKIRKSLPLEAIMAEEIFSRNVQFKGKIINLYDIKNQIKLPKSYDIGPNCTGSVTTEEGVMLTFENQTSTYIPVYKATVTGIAFVMNNVIFPRGISIGTSLREVVHSTEGKIGTPEYIIGSPFLGLDEKENILIYIDSVSGDRLSLTFDQDCLYIIRIAYEFSKYQ